MLILLFLCAFQEADTVEPEPLNAQIFLDSGEKIDLADVQVKSIDPYSFEFFTDGGSSIISLFRITRITRLTDSHKFEILFDSGEIQVGRINSVAILGTTVNEKDSAVVNTGDIAGAEPGQQKATYNLHHIARVHILSGFQLRSCPKGHYEQYTPYPFCPVCGEELVLGHYGEDLPESDPALPRYHRLRLDPRDPASTAIRQ